MFVSNITIMKLLVGTLFCSLAFFTNAQVDNGLIAKYSFNAGNANDEVGAINGTVNGATLTNDRFGNPNAAYSFDGDDYIDFGDDPVFQFEWNDFSYSIWFKLDTAQYAYMFGKSDFQTNYGMLIGSSATDPLDLTFGTNFRLLHMEDGELRYVNSTPTDTTNWHHAVVVHRYEDSTSLYIDNQFIGSDTTFYQHDPEGFNVAGKNLMLGKHSVFNIYFRGDADDIRMYDRALNLSEIDSLYNMPNTLGVESMEKATTSVYPNPAMNTIYIQSGSVLKGMQIDVLSIDGQRVLSTDVSSNDKVQLDVSALANGTYIIRIETSEGTTTSKFIKE